MERFSIDNLWGPVSLNQYLEIALKLDCTIKRIRPTVSSELLSMTNGVDYHELGSPKILAPEVEEALSRRETSRLGNLNKDLWTKSYETGLYIEDHTTEEPYIIALIVGEREPKSLMFYGQAMDSESKEVLNSFKKTRWFQRIGDGFGETSEFALGHAINSLGLKSTKNL